VLARSSAGGAYLRAISYPRAINPHGLSAIAKMMTSGCQRLLITGTTLCIALTSPRIRNGASPRGLIDWLNWQVLLPNIHNLSAASPSHFSRYLELVCPSCPTIGTSTVAQCCPYASLCSMCSHQERFTLNLPTRVCVQNALHGSLPPTVSPQLDAL
jgi:hypothetical protein